MSPKYSDSSMPPPQAIHDQPSPLPVSLPGNRRAFLGRGLSAGAALGAAWLVGTGCQEAHQRVQAITGSSQPHFVPLPHDADRTRQARHILNRVAWGPRPGDVARVAEIGTAAYLEEQLADHMEEDPIVAWRVNGLDIQQTREDAPDMLYSLSDEQLMRETQQAMLLRAVYSRHQLRENLADFWTNHFNIYALKKEGQTLIPTDTETVLRPHVLGRFETMLLGSAQSPAMLQYLDNQENRRGVANENYARELLELHTLGVHSGYTQRDIQEVARCFTGWTVQTGFRRGQFTYDPSLHDENSKHIPFLNLVITPNGGRKDAEVVLAQLARHPATARFLAGKLCRHFLGVVPPEILEKATNAYLKNNSDLRATLRPILLDGLLSPKTQAPILKRPLDLVLSAIRVLGADTDGGAALQKHLADMGQPLYQWPMPDGFPDKTSAWSGALLPRWNFALALAANSIEGTSVDLSAPLDAVRARNDDKKRDALLETIFALPADTSALRPVRDQLARHWKQAQASQVPSQVLLAEATGLLLASPVFQWK